ncbi:MAG: DUF58 domain-containing protein [Deltaproteobacteria bacterium]|nr:DUF58 domain-containing protein [Deltaproteobacteria bacterium]
MTTPQSRSTVGPVRITAIGLGYIFVSLLVAAAATNSGNNALFLVLALMLAFLVLSGLSSRRNVRGLQVRLHGPPEVFANRPFNLEFEVKSKRRWLPHWFLLVSADRRERARLVNYLPARGRSRGILESFQKRRGLQRISHLVVTSPFPFGFFFKTHRYKTSLELLVYPELFGPEEKRVEGIGELGDMGGARPGRGNELRQLRVFQPGDDPRGVHWKQTAKTGSMIFMEREEDQGRRVSILLDNGVSGVTEEVEARFERLVSEAATVAADLLVRGFEVELVTRDKHLRFASGFRQRGAILEALALVEPCPPKELPLESMDRRAPTVRLALDSQAGPIP